MPAPAAEAIRPHSTDRRSSRRVATVTDGAAIAATIPGTVIVQPARPAGIWKLDPIGVSRPIGNISIVTIEKMPMVSALTANHPNNGDRVMGAVTADKARDLSAIG